MKNRSATKPLFSIVVPSFNQGKFIAQTIASVLGQDYPNLELIIIDGGSTDDTAIIVEKYANSITHYVSEPDNGQAQAINKGFRLAKGDIFAWLNSDDMYLPCTLSKVARIIDSPVEPMLVYGGSILFSEGEMFTQGRLPPEFNAARLTYFDYIEQASTFWSRRLWETVGELNETYHYVLDWDWFIRASKICSFLPIKDYLSLYRLHETHKSRTGGSKRAEEIIKLVETYASEEWSSAYRDVYKHMPSLKSVLHCLSKRRLYRLRYLFYPLLYLNYGKHRIEDVILHVL